MTQTAPHKRNPTPRQRKAAREIVKNLLSEEPKPTGQILENIGYSKGVTETPKMVLETEGFKTALAETGLREALIAQGINPQKIAEKIGVLLNAEKKTFRNNVSSGEIEEVGVEPDYTAIDKGLKHATAIYGITEDKPQEGSRNTYNFIFAPQTQEKIRQMDNEIKNLLIQNVKEDKENVEAESEEPRSTE